MSTPPCELSRKRDYSPNHEKRKEQRMLRKRRNRPRWIISAVLLTVVSAILTTTAHAAKITDPRKCPTVTPGGTARHAYWCAKYAAVATVRQVMARRQAVARWYPPVYCDQAGSLLRWRCTTISAGDTWKVAVSWRVTSTGWHRYATVAQITP